MKKILKKKISSLLESIFEKYHHPGYIHPDPLEILFKYSDTADREIAGLIASSLSTGRVASILKAVNSILIKLPSPGKTIKKMSRFDLENTFKGFKYRFYNSESLVDLLIGIKNVTIEYGSLNSCFISCMNKSDKSIVPALSSFVSKLTKENTQSNNILPSPAKGSACKRLNLFLRWMVRKDIIDPGGWERVSPSLLLVPLDTHMFKISRVLGFVSRKSPDMKSAIEITENFKKYDSKDPVRFDFSLTRLGIHPLLNYSRLLIAN